MKTVRLLCGTGRSARAGAMDALMREHWGRAVLVTPAYAYAALRRESLLLESGLPGAWGNPVQPFTEFVRGLLSKEGLRVRQLDDFGRRLLLERCLRRLADRGVLESIGAGPENAGLVSHLLRVLTQLKQAAIEPEAFRARMAEHESESPFHRIVAEVYEAYQAALKAGGWYDVPGLYWEADACCRAGKPRALTGIDALLFEGFDDFTPSEFRLIQSLAPHVGLLALGLHCDLRPDRRDLYALPRKIMEQIEAAFHITAEGLETPPPRRYSEYAADTIFWRDTPRFPEGLAPDLSVAVCADRLHEIEVIGRRVKRLIREQNTPPGRIAVVFRNLSEHANTIRGVFSAFGVPIRMLHRPRVSESALGGFLLRLLELPQEWGREAVLDVLCSPYWRPDAEGVATAAPWLARTAQVIGGYDEWIQRLEILAQRLEQSESERMADVRKRFPEAAVLARALCGEAARCKQLCEALPAQGSGRRFADALDALLDALGLEEVLAAADAVWAEQERASLQATRRLLSTLANIDPEEEFQRGEFVARLTRGMQETTYAVPSAPGGVACLDAASARNMAFDHVFFGGLIEGAVPMPPAMSAVYSERDIERLRAADVTLESRREHGARERLLFHHVLASGRQSVTLFRRLQKEGGREAAPSPFLTDVQGLFPPEAGIVEPPPRADSFLPAWSEISSAPDLRNALFFDKNLYAAHAQARFPELAEAAAIEALRQDESPFGAYDGVVSDAELVAALARRYGETHQFSVDQIETYLQCPFSFFTDRILNIDETEVPEAEFDPRVRGIILHDILQRFHRQYIGVAPAEIPEEEGLEALRGLAADAFQTYARRSATAPPGVVKMEERRMGIVLERYFRIARAADDAAWKPAHLEVAFGKVQGPKEDPLCSDEPYVMDTEAGPVRFAGRIDRIDFRGEGARILDYKSSSPPSAGEITSGVSLQLSVYAWALQEFLLPEKACGEAAFVQVGRQLGKKSPYREMPAKDKSEREILARKAIRLALNGIRNGKFPPTPVKEGCKYCPMAHACRHEEARIARKHASSVLAPDEEAEE